MTRHEKGQQINELTKKFKDNELPSMSNSLLTSLSPVLIIGFSTVIIEFLDTNSFTYEFFKFLGISFTNVKFFFDILFDISIKFYFRNFFFCNMY